MKKLLLSMGVMLFTVGAWAQEMVTAVKTDCYYTMECCARDGHENTRFIYDDGTIIQGQSATPTYFVFEAVEGAEGQYYIKSFVTGKYLNAEGGSVSASTSTENRTKWFIGTPSGVGDAKAVYLHLAGNTNSALNNLSGSSETCKNLRIMSHTPSYTSNGCSCWTLREFTYDGMLSAPLNEWKAAQLAALGWVGGYPESLREKIEGLTVYSQIATFETENAKAKVEMKEGYYFFKSTENRYLLWESKADETYGCYAKEVNNPEINQIWKAVKNGEGYKFLACNINAYLQLGNAGTLGSGPSPLVESDNDASTFVIEKVSDLVYNIKTEGDGKYIRYEGSGHGYAVNDWNTEKKSFNIIPATEISVNLSATDEKGVWGTIHLPFGVSLPEGLTAYSVSQIEGASASLEAHNSISANQGAILNATAAGEYKLTINDEAAAWGSNGLLGSNVNAEVGEAYILANGDNGIGLYKVKDGESNVLTCQANKAYLPASVVVSEANGLKFVFGAGETDGISGVSAAKANNAIYDLSGRRVKAAQKGIFIVNGKKIVK